MRLTYLPLTLAFIPVGAIADEPIPVVDAVNRAGQTVTVRMEVKSAAAGRGGYFLNSETDWNSPKNFVAFIPIETAERFKQSGIDNPAEFFNGKTILVTGTVVLNDHKPRIKVEQSDRIEIVR
jgi:hypothetical protein